MTALQHARPATMDIVELTAAYFSADPDARLWARYPDAEEGGDLLPDCDQMSRDFALWASMHGWAARLEHCEPVAPAYSDAGDHYFTVVTDGFGQDWAVDLTARQFYNVQAIDLDPDLIPCPMIFPYRRGHHPLFGPVAVIPAAPRALPAAAEAS